MKLKVRHILYVEDNETDFELMMKFLTVNRSSVSLDRARDGEEALDYVFRRGEFSQAQRPDLILLDLNLPKMDGRQVLKELKNHPEVSAIPVVIFTSSELDSDVIKSYEMNASSYLIKPFELSDFENTVKTFGDYWIGLVAIAPLPKLQK